MNLRKVGRPLKIETQEQMEKILNEYFETTDENKITITGICLALDLDKKLRIILTGFLKNNFKCLYINIFIMNKP